MRRNSSSVVNQGSGRGGRLNFKTSMGKYADQRYTLTDKDTVEIHTGECNTYKYLDISYS